MNNKISVIFIVSMLTIFICGEIFFLSGFFPIDYSQSDDFKVTTNKRPTEVNGISIVPPKRQHDQIILMIVDALRYDFLNPTHELPYIHENHCDRLKMRVAIPTVTMPRIKSLTTGTISNFIDVIRNLGETEELRDSIIHVLRKRGDIINFAGDRTWTTLFPSEFTRKKANMDSFYVNDFYDGDKQVAETLRTEINQTDWSLFIMHFLGLDHIGHVEGSESSKIPSKLIEMDNVIREIGTNVNFKNRLLLVTGDHGMKNGGGHGGSSEEELLVPLVFFKQSCHRTNLKSKEYNQIDLTATLSILLSVEIPQPSIGCLIYELLSDLSFDDILYAYFYNAHHLMHKAMEKYGFNHIKKADYFVWYEHAKSSHTQYLEAKQANISTSFAYEQALANYKRVATEISSHMSESLVTFDYGYISVGLLLTTMTTFYILMVVLFAQRDLILQNLLLRRKMAVFSLILGFIINLIAALMGYFTESGYMAFIFVTCSTIIGIYVTLGALKILQQLVLPLQDESYLRLIWCFPIPTLVCFLLTTVVLVSTSYIEEEMESWYYLGCTSLLILIATRLWQNLREDFLSFENVRHCFLNFRVNKAQALATLGVLVVMRLFKLLNGLSSRAWHNVSNEVKTLVISLLLALGLVWLILHLRKFNTPRQMICCMLAALMVYCYRGFQGQVVFLPISVAGSYVLLLSFWACVLGVALLESKSFIAHGGRYKLLKFYLTSLLLIAALLHKARNLILVPSMICILNQIYDFCDNLKIRLREPYRQSYVLAYKTLMTIFVANIFYFYQGNSNSLATIDLNPGYIGQSTYTPWIVAVFVSLNTFCSPIIAFVYFTLHILKMERVNSGKGLLVGLPSIDEVFQPVISLYCICTLIPTAFYLCLMVLFRYHLFIYSVFAPKVFYECYRVLVFYINYCIINFFLHMAK